MGIAAHPDDAEYDGAGVAMKWARQGHHVKFVSTTNGDIGHWQMAGGPLALRRKKEGLAVARRLGLPADVLAEAESAMPEAQRALEALLAALEAKTQALEAREAAAAARAPAAGAAGAASGGRVEVWPWKKGRCSAGAPRKRS